MAVPNAVENLTLKPAPVVFGSDTRRFDLPDLDRHAAWFMPRFLKNYPHLNERAAIGFLRGVIYHNEFKFMFQEKGAALFQMMGAHSLDATQVVWERFVWVADPENKAYTDAAAFFYKDALQWCKFKSVDIMMVEQNTDVPHEMIRQQIGRLYATEQKFARVKDDRVS